VLAGALPDLETAVPVTVIGTMYRQIFPSPATPARPE